MKKTTQRIVEELPMLEDKLFACNDVESAADALQSLDEVERTFLKLAWFFENPEHEQFDLNTLYKHLDDQWLEWALELIVQYFQEDTYLIKKPTFSLVKENDSNYLNQSQFAVFLTENGLRYDRAKVKNYYDRGIIPPADLVVSGTNYWKKSTVQQYCEKEQLRLNTKDKL